VPVRGAIVGPECLASVLEKVPDTLSVPSPVSPFGDWLARAGFGLVVALTLLPWSRFGQGSRILGAWAPNWSLLAAVAALVGLGLTLFVPRRPVDPRLAATGYAILAVSVALGALLHVYRPPLLSEASAAALVALVGAGLALLGAVLKARAVYSAGRLHS
jgi:hypothetical protein